MKTLNMKKCLISILTAALLVSVFLFAPTGPANAQEVVPDVSQDISPKQDEPAPAPPSPSPSKEAEPIITKDRTIEVRAGERKVIYADAEILDVAVTRPEVADAFATGVRELTLTANSPGVGKVVIHLEGGDRIAFKMRVHVADPEKFADELRKKLGHIKTIDIEVIKERILVDGRVLYLKDMDEVERALGDNPSIINLTSLSSRNARILSREIERELRESGIYGASVEVRDNRVTLVGTLPSKRLAEKAEKIASSYTPDFDNLLEVAP
jgi:Flp pilus assembly secretin CpaC